MSTPGHTAQTPAQTPRARALRGTARAALYLPMVAYGIAALVFAILPQ